MDQLSLIAAFNALEPWRLRNLWLDGEDAEEMKISDKIFKLMLPLKGVLITYALRCQGPIESPSNHTFYIGITTRAAVRMVQHFRGSGSAAVWTRAHPPLALEDFAIGNLEDSLTVAYARHHGSDQVRGGGVTTMDGRAWKGRNWQKRLHCEGFE